MVLQVYFLEAFFSTCEMKMKEVPTVSTLSAVYFFLFWSLSNLTIGGVCTVVCLSTSNLCFKKCFSNVIRWNEQLQVPLTSDSHTNTRMVSASQAMSDEGGVRKSLKESAAYWVLWLLWLMQNCDILEVAVPLKFSCTKVTLTMHCEAYSLVTV